MFSSAFRFMLLGGLAIWPLSAAAEILPPQAGAQQAGAQQAGAQARPGPKELSQGFWAEWKDPANSERVSKLAKAVGYGDRKAAAVAAAVKARRQAVVPIAISKPKEAAKLLSEASGSQGDTVTAQAMATVVNMRVAPATRNAAISYVAPAARQRVETWNANLSTGIRGLPGVYLGGNQQSSSAGALSAPAGYVPVSGGSFGCGVR